MRFYVGDKVKVVKPDRGCYGVGESICTVTDKEPTNGLTLPYKNDTINVETKFHEVWRVNTNGCELVERAVPAKEDLVGKIILTRNCNEYLVLKTHSGNIFGLNIDDTSFYIDLSTYDAELRCGSNNNFDIMYIKEINEFTTFDILYKTKKKTIWERPEEKVKEMTMADIEALVGCKVKIVKE